MKTGGQAMKTGGGTNGVKIKEFTIASKNLAARPTVLYCTPALAALLYALLDSLIVKNDNQNCLQVDRKCNLSVQCGLRTPAEIPKLMQVCFVRMLILG